MYRIIVDQKNVRILIHSKWVRTFLNILTEKNHFENLKTFTIFSTDLIRLHGIYYQLSKCCIWFVNSSKELSAYLSASSLHVMCWAEYYQHYWFLLAKYRLKRPKSLHYVLWVSTTMRKSLHLTSNINMGTSSKCWIMGSTILSVTLLGFQWQYIHQFHRLASKQRPQSKSYSMDFAS